jgi:peptidoglycan hydrolase CwlO-like protein
MSDDNNQQPAAADVDALQRSIEALEAKNKELIAELRRRKAPMERWR